MVRLQLREVATASVRCVLCHDALAQQRVTCRSCSALLHDECAASWPICPTLGCRQWLGARARLRRPCASWVQLWWRFTRDRHYIFVAPLVAVLVALAAVIVFAELSACVPF